MNADNNKNRGSRINMVFVCVEIVTFEGFAVFLQKMTSHMTLLCKQFKERTCLYQPLEIVGFHVHLKFLPDNLFVECLCKRSDAAFSRSRPRYKCTANDLKRSEDKCWLVFFSFGQIR